MLRYAPPDRLNIPGSLQDGLDPAQIKIRQQQYSDNRIVEIPSSGWRDILRNTLQDSFTARAHRRAQSNYAFSAGGSGLMGLAGLT